MPEVDVLDPHQFAAAVWVYPWTFGGVLEMARRGFVAVCFLVGLFWILDKAGDIINRAAVRYADYRAEKRWDKMLATPPGK
jgi:hypothetical protein